MCTIFCNPSTERKKTLLMNFLLKHADIGLKRIFNVILSDHLWKDRNVRFTKVPLIGVSLQR